MKTLRDVASWVAALLVFGAVACGKPEHSGTGTAQGACARYSAHTGALAACNALGGSCPSDVEALLAAIADAYAFDDYEVFESDGLREVKSLDSYAGSSSFVFDDEGALVGFRLSRGESTFGPCSRYSYEFGLLPSADDRDPTTVHHCDLDVNALHTGELCDCPCPDPAPENGVYACPEACTSVGASPRCEPSFQEQLHAIGTRTARMRSGCGFRTLTLQRLGCSYDIDGGLVGSERARGDDARDECPGVDVHRAGDVPSTCDDDTVCYFGSEAPEGSAPCPPEG